MIALVDYRAGNLTSVKKALDHMGANAVITRDTEVVAEADKDHSARCWSFFGDGDS